MQSTFILYKRLFLFDCTLTNKTNSTARKTIGNTLWKICRFCDKFSYKSSLFVYILVPSHNMELSLLVFSASVKLH